MMSRNDSSDTLALRTVSANMANVGFDGERRAPFCIMELPLRSSPLSPAASQPASPREPRATHRATRDARANAFFLCAVLSLMPAPQRPPQHVRDLNTSQLRYLLLAKLPPGVGVVAWGADHAELLELAAENGVSTLTEEDIEEVGPAGDDVKQAGRSASVDMERRLKRARVKRELERNSSNWKFSAQMILITLLALVQAGKLQSVKAWLGMAPPALPTCEPPTVWQSTLPFLFDQPGAQGECVVRQR